MGSLQLFPHSKGRTHCVFLGFNEVAMTILLIVVIVLLLGGGGGYYYGPWRPSAGPNHIIGVVLTILVILILLRLLGIY